ncbi:Activating signal cointegrator 1 complex subunit 2, partial [Dimargaris xerosporica]
MDLSVFAEASQSNQTTLDSWLSQWQTLLRKDGSAWLEYLESGLESADASPKAANTSSADTITVASVLAFLSNLSLAVVRYDVQVAVDPNQHGTTSPRRDTIPPEWVVAVDPSQCHFPVLLGRLIDNILQWFERCTGLDKAMTASLDSFDLQRLSRISQQHALYHASTLNQLASIGASVWCRQLQAVRPDELMCVHRWNQRIGQIIRQCWDTATLVVHSFRVLGHERYESLKAAFSMLQQASLAEPERPVTTDRTWHAVCATIMEELTAITHICQASPRAGWKQLAEHLELFTLLVQLYYYYSQLVTSHQSPATTGASINSVPSNVTRRCIQGAWLTSSVIYLVLVLAGFPKAECQRAWSDLWSASPTRVPDFDALCDDMAPMFVTATPSSSKAPLTHPLPSSSSSQPDRRTQLGQYCMAIIEKSQAQPVATQGTQASLWVMLNRRFNVLASLQAIQSQEPDNEPLAYAIMFITNQTDRSTAETAVTSKMANLSVQATTPPLSADLAQALELAQCMDPIEYTAAISNIQEIFSDLGSGYILALLALKGYNGEQVIMDLLEEQVPNAVQVLDTKLAVDDLFALLRPPSPAQEQDEGDPLVNRLNVFDGDEFDVFRHGTAADSSRVYRKVDAGGWPM